ncbi:peptidoglycan DD-metalloendopeptidase family protein [Halanaerobaculum tunisiense]
MSENKSKKEITLQIIPHTSQDVFRIRIPKKWLRVAGVCLLVSLVSLLGCLYYYYTQYDSVQQKIATLKPYEQQNKQLKKKNEHLYEKLAKLSRETEKIKEQFSQLKKENRKIKQMVDFNSQPDQQAKVDSTTVKTVSYTPKQANENVVRQAEKNVSSLQKDLPQGEQKLSQLKEDVTRYKDYLASKPQGWPIKKQKGKISSAYGYRDHPVLNRKVFHDGVDIGVWYNHKAIATGRGKVIFAGQKQGYGKAIIIDHGYGYRTLYGHNKRLLVRVGEQVSRGQTIALTGNTGRSTGPHLHYEIQYQGKPINPIEYIK